MPSTQLTLTDLQFDYPPEFVALEKKTPSRVLVVDIQKQNQIHFHEDSHELVSRFNEGDVLVINNTRVLARRLFSESGFEILFLNRLMQEGHWQVLCPSSQWPKNQVMKFAEGVEASLIERGRTQIVHLNQNLTEDYFSKYGDLPLPPYILKARKEKRTRVQDNSDYQTAWSKIPGSFAAPTASLHFSQKTIEELKSRGVQICEMTLHVGLGTFLPITSSLEEHKMHAEDVSIPKETWENIQKAKDQRKRIWALGTTVTRALESASLGMLEPDAQGNLNGETDIFIKPGFEFKVVDCLLTNFHQPESTLLALVAAFAGLENVRKAYRLAIENKFRLFSYGDLSAWIK